MAKKSSPVGKPEIKNSHILFLHNIRSVFNVGALFRTADAVGITDIVLSGYTPTPIDRFGRPRPDFAKCALGAEKTVSWKYVKTPFATLKKLRQEKYMIIGVEQDDRSVDYKKAPFENQMAIVLGTETTGMTKALRDACDILVEIPMQGKKESLNVSVAGGIVLYRLLDR